jgi:hypothetical protein
MNLSKEKTANQLYKQERQSGRTTLDFKSWLAGQKSRNFLDLTGAGSVPVNQSLNDPIQQLLGQIHQEGGQQTTLDSTYTFGVKNSIWRWSFVGLGVLATIIVVHQLRKK